MYKKLNKEWQKGYRVVFLSLSPPCFLQTMTYDFLKHRSGRETFLGYARLRQTGLTDPINYDFLHPYSFFFDEASEGLGTSERLFMRASSLNWLTEGREAPATLGFLCHKLLCETGQARALRYLRHLCVPNMVDPRLAVGRDGGRYNKSFFSMNFILLFDSYVSDTFAPSTLKRESTFAMKDVQPCLLKGHVVFHKTFHHGRRPDEWNASRYPPGSHDFRDLLAYRTRYQDHGSLRVQLAKLSPRAVSSSGYTCVLNLLLPYMPSEEDFYNVVLVNALKSHPDILATLQPMMGHIMRIDFSSRLQLRLQTDRLLAFPGMSSELSFYPRIVRGSKFPPGVPTCDILLNFVHKLLRQTFSWNNLRLKAREEFTYNFRHGQFRQNSSRPDYTLPRVHYRTPRCPCCAARPVYSFPFFLALQEGGRKPGGRRPTPLHQRRLYQWERTSLVRPDPKAIRRLEGRGNL